MAMNRFITQALVFGVALAETAGNPLPKLSPGLSLSSGANSTEGNDVLNPGVVLFEYLNQCAEVNMDKETCLASKTIDAIVDMEEGSSSLFPTPSPSSLVTNPGLQSKSPSSSHSKSAKVPPSPSPTPGAIFMRHRFLQEDDCAPPPLEEQDLRDIMDSFVGECSVEVSPVSDEEYNSTLSDIMQILENSSCFQKICDEDPASTQLMEIMIEEIAKCAGVEPDINDCIMDQVIDMMVNDEEDVNMSSDANRVRRHLQDSSSCEGVSEYELAWFMSLMVGTANETCSELGIFSTPVEIDKMVDDLTAIFLAQHCWGNTGDSCEETDHDDNWYSMDDDTPMKDDNSPAGIDMWNVAVKYVQQCADAELAETCLVSTTMALFASGDDDSPVNQHSPSRRFLQTTNECAPPDVDEFSLRYIIGESRHKCEESGLNITQSEFDGTVADFMAFFGAESCWVALCEEEESEMLMMLIVEEIVSCADSDLMNLDQCLLDQIFGILFAPDSSDDLGAVRRKLEHALGQSDEDPCADQASEAELSFISMMLVAGAQEQCMEMGMSPGEDASSQATLELMKFFGAQHCWGVPNDCDDTSDDTSELDRHDSTYIEFIDESSIWMLSECAQIENTCTLSRSIEVMRGMKHLGWSHDGKQNPHHIAQEMVTNMCTPPSVDVNDINKIVTHAKQHCLDAGKLVLESHYDQSYYDLKNLVAKPHCFEDLCEPEVKNIIIEEWMHTCSLTGLKYLTTDGPYDSDRLKCMTEYIVASRYGEGHSDEHWSCTLSHLGHATCNIDIGKEAYIHCGGETPPPAPPAMPSSTTTTPTNSQPMHFSMSFAYDEYDEFNWAQNDQSKSFSYGYDQQFSYSYDGHNDDGFSMPYDDWYGDDDDHHMEDPHLDMMHMYIDEVCNVIEELNTGVAQHCLQPVCDFGVEDAWTFALGDGEPTPASPWPTPAPTMLEVTNGSSSTPSPTAPLPAASTSPTTSSPVSTSLTLPPSALALPSHTPSSQPSSRPSVSPTSQPSGQPSTSPTEVERFGEVQVAVEMSLTLEGISIDQIDLTSLDALVDVLMKAFQDAVPRDAIVRILSVGGFSVARKLLRYLQDSSTGVPIEFEIVMTDTCASASCDAAETDQISANLYNTIKSEVVTKIEDGSVVADIKAEADAQGVSSLSNVQINAATMSVSEAKVTVKEAQPPPSDDDDDDTVDPVDDDDSSGITRSVACTTAATAVGVSFLLWG